MTLAPAPSRATSSTVLTAGLMSIPVKIYAGTDKTGIQTKRYVRGEDGVLIKVGQRNVREDTGATVEWGDIVSVVETEHGPVEISKEEREAAYGAPGSADIEAFVPLGEFSSGAFLPDGLLQIRPGKGAEQPFAVLIASMRKRGVVAIGKAVLRKGSAATTFALLPTGAAYRLAPSSSVRAPLPLPEVAADKAPAVEAAGALIDAMTKSAAEVSVPDHASQALADVLAGKAPVEIADRPAGAETPGQVLIKDVDDIMAALEASLAARQSA